MRSITLQADANVSISAEPERDAELPRERIATITGSCLHTLRAIGLIVDKLLKRPFVEPGEPPFEGQFPSSRMALLARTGHLRNPPGLLQQHMQPQHMLQQQHQQPQQQMQMHPVQQQQHQQQQAASLAPAASQPIYAQPAAGGSTFLYFPLQPGPAPVLPLAASMGMQMAMQMPAPGPHGAGALASHLPAMPTMSGMTLAAPAALMAAPMPPPPQAAAAPAAASQGGGGSMGQAQAASAEGAAQPDVLGPRLEVSIEVPENRVGLLIGRGGETLHSMQRLMNVSIHIARRPPGPAASGSDSGATPASGSAPKPADASSMRRVTISGARNAVNIAHAFILQRLSGGSGGPSGGPSSVAVAAASARGGRAEVPPRH